MYQPPWFRDDIGQRLISNFYYYFTANDWGLHFLIICLVLGSFLLFLRPTNQSYTEIKPNKVFLWQDGDWTALIYPAAVVIFYLYIFYHQEPSIFSFPDLMAQLNLDIFKNGVTPVYGQYNRVRPFGFWENNIFYAISENMYILNLTVWLSVLAFMTLLYFWLNFIPVKKRLALIGLLVLLPGYFWLNNIIFNERIWLIEIIASLMFLRRFIFYGGRLNLALFALLMNIAIYSKETITLLYAGILLAFGLEKILSGKLIPKDFLHPLQLLRKFPVEVVLFASLLFFFVFYHLHLFSITDSAYLEKRTGSFPSLIQLYWYETVVSLIAAGVLVCRLAGRKIDTLWDGIALGSLAVTGYVYYLKLVPESQFMAWKSYYLIIPGVFLTIYVLNATKNRKIFYAAVCFLTIYAVAFNLSKIDVLEGQEYRETAEFIEKESKTGEPFNLYMSPHSELNIWWYGAWASALKYVLPDRIINIKLFALPKYQNELTLLFYQNDTENYQPIRLEKEKPQPGDYYMLRRNEKYQEDMKFLSGKKYQKVLKNRSFEIYLVQP